MVNGPRADHPSEHQNDTREPSVAESLPAYTTSSIPLNILPPNPFHEVDQTIPFLKNHGRGVMIGAIFFVTVLVVGVLAGIVVHNNRT